MSSKLKLFWEKLCSRILGLFGMSFWLLSVFLSKYKFINCRMVLARRCLISSFIPYTLQNSSAISNGSSSLCTLNVRSLKYKKEY